MKISIIVPVYNVEEYIIECLESVAKQTMTKGVECILVDDCGKDDSIKIATEYIFNYVGNIRFTILHHEKNGGLSAARNTGINAAKGEYVYFLDSDDTITPDCMETMWRYVERYGNVDMVHGMFAESQNRMERKLSYPLPEFTRDTRIIKKHLLTYRGDVIPAQTKMIRRSLLVENNLFFKEGIIHEDNHFTFFLAKYVKSLAYSKERTYYYRINPNSITHNVNIKKEIFAYKTLVETLSKNIDLFLCGTQKEYILSNLLTAISLNYYTNEEERDCMIESFLKHNSYIERFLFNNYLKTKNEKFIRFLIRLYKISNRW